VVAGRSSVDADDDAGADDAGVDGGGVDGGGPGAVAVAGGGADVGPDGAAVTDAPVDPVEHAAASVQTATATATATATGGQRRVIRADPGPRARPARRTSRLPANAPR